MLTITKENWAATICGSEDVLRAELYAWEAYKARGFDEAIERVRLVEGFADTARRQAATIAYTFDDELKGLILEEL